MQVKLSSSEEKVEEIYDYQIDTDEVEKKNLLIENHSRRNNLLINGVSEENGESWYGCKQKLKEFLMDKYS